MKLKQALQIIRQNMYYISVEIFANAIQAGKDGVQKRIERESEIKYEEIIMLCKHFNLNPKLFYINPDEFLETMPIDWYENKKLNLYKNPKIKRYYLPIDYLNEYKPNCTQDDFKIISMIGDKMNGGVLYMRDKDTLLIDTKEKDLTRAGFFVYECENGNYLAISGVEKLTMGRYKFYYNNPQFRDEFREEEFLQKAKFRVIGRVIRNLSFFA